MSTIWFIRHGESISNAGQRTPDPIYTWLTVAGEEQAKDIAEAFPTAPSLIITSSYWRTHLTAKPTQNRFQNIPQYEWPVHEFTYLSRSRTKWKNIKDRLPMVEAFWKRADPYYEDGDGAESFEDFINRVYGVLGELHHRKEDFIAVFTHGQFMQAILWMLETSPTGLNPGTMQQFKQFRESYPIDNGAIIKAEFWGKENYRISSPDTSHLRGRNLCSFSEGLHELSSDFCEQPTIHMPPVCVGAAV